MGVSIFLRQMNHYPHHLGDYATGTQGFTQADHGAYRLLMDAYYSTEKPLPAEDVYAISKAGTPLERKATAKVLARKFSLRDGLYHHKRIDEELEAYRQRADVARENGKKGGRKPTTNPRGNPVGIPQVTEQIAQSEPGSEADSKLASNHKPENPNTAFPVLETSRQPPAESGTERKSPHDKRRPGLLDLLRKHRVMGIDEHPLLVERILESARDEAITQALHEAARSKGGGPYDIGYFDTIVARIAKAANEAAAGQRAAADARVAATSAMITEQRERASEAAPMPQAISDMKFIRGVQ